MIINTEYRTGHSKRGYICYMFYDNRELCCTRGQLLANNGQEVGPGKSRVNTLICQIEAKNKYKYLANNILTIRLTFLITTNYN